MNCFSSQSKCQSPDLSPKMTVAQAFPMSSNLVLCLKPVLTVSNDILRRFEIDSPNAIFFFFKIVSNCQDGEYTWSYV